MRLDGSIVRSVGRFQAQRSASVLWGGQLLLLRGGFAGRRRSRSGRSFGEAEICVGPKRTMTAAGAAAAAAVVCRGGGWSLDSVLRYVDGIRGARCHSSEPPLGREGGAASLTE